MNSKRKSNGKSRALNGGSGRFLKKQKISRPEILKTVDSGLNDVDDLDDMKI